jgi:hypothetical protein
MQDLAVFRVSHAHRVPRPADGMPEGGISAWPARSAGLQSAGALRDVNPLPDGIEDIRLG